MTQIEVELMLSKFCHACPVPYSLCSRVDVELEHLKKRNIITFKLVTFSKWAAPSVPGLKGDGKVQICGDFKITLSLVRKTDSNLFPKIEDLFATHVLLELLASDNGIISQVLSSKVSCIKWN